MNTGEPIGPVSIFVALYPNYLRTGMIKANSVSSGVILASTQVQDVTVNTVPSTARGSGHKRLHRCDTHGR